MGKLEADTILGGSDIQRVDLGDVVTSFEGDNFDPDKMYCIDHIYTSKNIKCLSTATEKHPVKPWDMTKKDKEGFAQVMSASDHVWIQATLNI
jgi:hypothetical protein